MARTVKPPDVRRNEILDTAQRLFYSRGYGQTSVQDIIDEIGIAKGTFYHHFGSKSELLDALIARMVDQSMGFIEAIAFDESLDATAKFRRLFEAIASWKAQSRPFLLDVLRPLYADENTVLLQKLRTKSTARVLPIFAQIINQGVAEGSFHTEYSDQIGEIIMVILVALSDSMAQLILHKPAKDAVLAVLEAKVAVTQHAIERLLGATPGALPIMNLETLKPWFM